ncbi:hypothetical protein BDV12DRAFT_202467 [Aspergillus spectabilis]
MQLLYWGWIFHLKNSGTPHSVSLGPWRPSGPPGEVYLVEYLPRTHWKWLFCFLSLLGAVVFGINIITVPPDEQIQGNQAIDWVGAYLGASGLTLLNFVWNQAPAVGWATPYEYALLKVAFAHLVGFLFWEKKLAKDPLLPFDIWTTPSFLAVNTVSFLSFMSFGILIWYITVWLLTTWHWSLLLTSAAVVPLAILGAVAALISAWLVPRLSGQYLLAIGNLCAIAATTLVATIPDLQSYWLQLFPAAVLMAFCPDFIFTAAQIIASNSVKRHQQGVASSLIGTLITYGQSIGLGFAGTVEKY